MTTWGEEEDFKSYLPKLFAFIFLEKNADEICVLICKLKRVKQWTREETQAISTWVTTYAEMNCTDAFKTAVQRCRMQVQDWLEGGAEELSCDFPLSVFLEDGFAEMQPLLEVACIERFARVLDLWPFDGIDLIAYASCASHHQVFSDRYYGIFEENGRAWMRKHADAMEALFWQTEDPRLQQIFLDALPPNVYV